MMTVTAIRSLVGFRADELADLRYFMDHHGLDDLSDFLKAMGLGISLEYFVRERDLAEAAACEAKADRLREKHS